MIILDSFVFIIGALLVVLTLVSAVQTFVLPRGTRDLLTHFAFSFTWLFFLPAIRLSRSYGQRDRIMAFFAPFALLLLPATWLFLLLFAYMLMYWAAGVHPMAEAFILSGSSLFTLGFARTESTFVLTLVFTEAALGLSMVALLIAYLPTMNSAFQGGKKRSIYWKYALVHRLPLWNGYSALIELTGWRRWAGSSDPGKYGLLIWKRAIHLYLRLYSFVHHKQIDLG